MPKLTVSLPDSADASHDLVDEEITIGRLPDNSLQIEDISVSSHHATLTLRDGNYILRDIGSTNGTRLNGQDLEPDTDHPLKAGDRIRFGKIEAVYDPQEAGDAIPLPAEEEPALIPASASVLPSDFTNASPFQKKQKKKDPIGKAVLAFSAVAILAFLAAVVSVFSLPSPL